MWEDLEKVKTGDEHKYRSEAVKITPIGDSAGHNHL